MKDKEPWVTFQQHANAIFLKRSMDMISQARKLSCLIIYYFIYQHFLRPILPSLISCLIIAGNVGADHAIFEQGASAGNVGNEKIAQQKKANPVALLLSSAMMLRHLQFPSFADRLETAVKTVISEGKYRTKDLGGTSTTQEVVDAVIAALD